MGRSGLLLPVVLLIALNLRTTMSSLSPLLETIRLDLGLSHAAAGLLTTIPVLCMGLFPILADGVAARFGTERALLGGLGLIALGTAGRLAADRAAVLYATVLLVGIGIAAGQTLVPAVVKRCFPERGPVVLGLYATLMTLGSGLAAAATAPLAAAYGAWPPALATWSIPAIAAAVLWGLVSRNLAPSGAAPVAASGPAAAEAVSIRACWRSPIAWRISLFVAISSVLFWSLLTWLAPVYRERGWSDGEGGLLLAVNAVAQVAISIVVAALAGRTRDRRPGLALGLVGGMIGFGGVALLPTAAPWAWSALIGFSVGLLFPVGVMLPLDYGADPAEVRRLTAMSLSVGYLLAALGPFLLGWLRGATGGYAVPFLTLVLACAAMLTQVGPLRPRPLAVRA